MLATDLKGILADRAIVPPTGSTLALREVGVMDVRVAGTPSDIIAIDMRKIRHLPGIKGGECTQICDYLLVGAVKGKDVAVLVELKKTLGQNKKKGMEQLRRSLPILEYINSVYRIHYDLEPHESKLPVRYFLIGERISPRLDKQPVRPGRPIPSEKHKNITINMFVGSTVPFGLFRDG